MTLPGGHRARSAICVVVVAAAALFFAAQAFAVVVVYYFGTASSFVYDNGSVPSHNDAGQSDNQRSSAFASTESNVNTYCAACVVAAALWRNNYSSQYGIQSGGDQASFYTGGPYVYGRARCQNFTSNGFYMNCTKTRRS